MDASVINSGFVRTQPVHRKPKSVTFTGCWTCRTRKVKCDERRKDGCRVCEKAGLECAGYGVNLSWMTSGKRRDLQGQRRRMLYADENSAIYMPDDQIARALSTLDAIVAPVNTVEIGPFAVFRVHGGDKTDSLDRYIRDSLLVADQGYVQPTSNSFCMDDTTHRAQNPRPQRLQDETNGSTEKWNPRTDTRMSRLDLASCQESSLALRGKAAVPSPPILRLQESGSPYLELPVPLLYDFQTSMLMSHYINHVADLLQPVIHPSNPWRTTYFPFAIEAYPELFLSQSSSPSSYASVALFNSLLSSAAFHLRNVSGGSIILHKLGLKHRAKSLKALHAALTLPNDPHRYTVYLTAILSLVTIDTMTDEDSDFLIHLKACRQLRKSLGVFGDSHQQVDSICHFLSLLARTTTLDLGPKLWGLSELPLFDETPVFRSDERSIEYIYGVTPTLGNLLEKTCQIAEFLVSSAGSVTDVSLAAAKTVRDELSAWSIESEPFSSISPKQGPMLEIARCQARAFHNAVLIFYGRTVDDNEFRMEREAHAVWESLTEAENLKDKFMGGKKRAAPMSWPAFIAACEATDREAWTEWWSQIQGYGVGNFTKQWKIIQVLWNLMDTNKDVKNWRQALKLSGELILPI